MFTAIASLFFSGIFKIIPGLADRYVDLKKSDNVQGTKRQGIWAGALLGAAQADVENKRIAAAERSKNKILMGLYIMTLSGPVLYWFLFWMDTIFAGQTWSVAGFVIMDWANWDLPRAPERLESYGKEIIANGLFGTAAIVGLTKGAALMRASGMFGKR